MSISIAAVNAARIGMVLTASAAASASASAVPVVAMAALLVSIAARLAFLFAAPKPFERMQSAVALMQAASRSQGSETMVRPALLAGVMDQANDVVTALVMVAGAVLLVRSVFRHSRCDDVALPVVVTALAAGAGLVAAAQATSTGAPLGFWTGMDSPVLPVEPLPRGLVVGAAVAEALAAFLLAAGWACGPLVAAPDRKVRRGEACTICSPLALCLPGIDQHTSAAGVSCPGLPLPRAAPIAGIAAAIFAAVSASYSGALGLVLGAAPPSVPDAVPAADPAVLLPVAILGVAAASVALVVAARVVFVLPARIFGLRGGPSQLAAAVAISAVLAALAMEVAQPGSTGSRAAAQGVQSAADVVSSARSAVSAALQPGFDGAWELWAPHWRKLAKAPMVGSRSLQSPGTGMVILQFGLAAATVAMSHVIGAGAAAAAGAALFSFWGSGALHQALHDIDQARMYA